MDGVHCLVDSNVLIRWLQPADSDFAAVENALQHLVMHKTILCYTSQNVAEFWNACTRPAERNGYGLSPEEADRHARLFESRLLLLPDSLSVHEEWRRLLVVHRISGVQVHDARLVAAMHVYGVPQILTFNTRDFARFLTVEAVSPREMAAGV